MEGASLYLLRLKKNDRYRQMKSRKTSIWNKCQESFFQWNQTELVFWSAPHQLILFFFYLYWQCFKKQNRKKNLVVLFQIPVITVIVWLFNNLSNHTTYTCTQTIKPLGVIIIIRPQISHSRRPTVFQVIMFWQW